MDPPSAPVRALATSCFWLPLSLSKVHGHCEATEQKASPLHTLWTGFHVHLLG